MTHYSDSKDEKIRKYMIAVHEQHTDKECGILNMTSLAEDAASEFTLYGDDGEDYVEEEVFELAFEVADSLNLLN